jgi:hypothetical protein
MDDGALDDTLETGGRLGVLIIAGDKVLQLLVNIGGQRFAQLVNIDIAGPHHRRRVAVIQQRQQQMFERGIFMMPLVCERQRLVKRMFKTLGKSGHQILISFP